jgi:hypothetical protein
LVPIWFESPNRMPETGKEADVNPADVTIREPERALE